MKSNFEIEAILYRVLNNDKDLCDFISGSVYVGNTRPEDSHKEDIVINTIAITLDHLPQQATTNCNIYAPDIYVSINGKRQYQADRQRLMAISDKVLDIIRNNRTKGLKMITETSTLLSEPTIKQHFMNLRITWNIQIE